MLHDVIATRLEQIIENGSDGDALRAIEAWTSRVHGKPKETVETVEGVSETEQALKALTPAQRLELWQHRGLRSVG